MKVNVLEAKNRLSERVKAAQAGQTVVIANRGKPVASLVAAPPTAVTVPAGAHTSAWLDAHPLPVHARRSGQDIDAGLALERRAWD
jgi:prevent-host-death family protein